MKVHAGIVELTLSLHRAPSWFVARSIVAVVPSDDPFNRGGARIEMHGGGGYEVLEAPPEVMVLIEKAMA